MATMLTDDNLFENRHSKEKHERDLANAHARRAQILENALQHLTIHKLEIETNHANKITQNAQTILALEKQKAEAENKQREAERATREIQEAPPRIPTPPPRVAPAIQSPNPSPPVQPAVHSPAPQQPVQPPTLTRPSQSPVPEHVQSSVPEVQAVNPFQKSQNAQPAVQEAHHSPPAAQAVQAVNLFQNTQKTPPIVQEAQRVNPFQTQSAPQTAPTVARARVEPVATVTLDPRIAALRQIHIQCKKLRQHITTLPAAFKNEAGQMRRKIKMTVGQLTSESNSIQIQNIRAVFTRSLTFDSQVADPRLFILARPDPVADAKHNGEQMPIMFLYLMSIFTKTIVAQLIDEASSRSEAAEPIGVLAHQVFSHPDYQWRNCSFVDILIAKYYVACPILFGSTGNERTEAGRISIGWKYDNGVAIPAAVHTSRMTGLAVGYAALTLRNYSKTSRQNPYSPHHYWTCIATITNTDPMLICPTQFTVLKGLIEHHTDKFLAFYGDQALAALRVAVVSFPASAKESSIEAMSLQVLANKWANEDGFYIT